MVRQNITYTSKLNPVTKSNLKVLMRIGKHNREPSRIGPGPLIIIK